MARSTAYWYRKLCAHDHTPSGIPYIYLLPMFLEDVFVWAVPWVELEVEVNGVIVLAILLPQMTLRQEFLIVPGERRGGITGYSDEGQDHSLSTIRGHFSLELV